MKPDDTIEVQELAMTVVDGTAQRLVMLRCACGARHFEPTRPAGLMVWQCPKCERIVKAVVP